MSKQNRKRTSILDTASLFPEIGAPHRTFSKSSSAPPPDSGERSWLAKLGKLFKSISSVDPESRDQAVKATAPPATQQATTRVVHVAKGPQTTGAPAKQQQQQLRRDAAPGAQRQSPTAYTHVTPLASPGSEVGPQEQEHGSNGSSAASTSSGPSKLVNFKRIISGVFGFKGAQSQAQQGTGPGEAPSTHAAHAERQGTVMQDRRLGDAGPSGVQPRVGFRELPGGRPRRSSNIVAIADDLPAGMDRPVWCFDDYSHLQELHSGYASSVYRAVCRHSGEIVVLKIYQPATLHEISRHQLLREARLHVQLVHPNIIRLYAAFKEDDGVVLVQEYADEGDLLQLLVKSGSRLNERTTVRLVVAPILKALYYLHSKFIVHRDVKLENILFSGADYTLKLADFGLCLNLREERSVTRAGTLDYMAPEVLKCPTKNLPEDNKDRHDLAYNCAVDVWAVGVVAYELLNGVPPFTRNDRQETEKLIMCGGQPPFLVHASEFAKEFIYCCLVHDSKERPSAWQLLRYPWIKMVPRPTSGQAYSSLDSKAKLLRQKAKAAVLQEVSRSQPAGQPLALARLAANLQAGSAARKGQELEEQWSDEGEEDNREEEQQVYEDPESGFSGQLPNSPAEITPAPTSPPAAAQQSRPRQAHRQVVSRAVFVSPRQASLAPADGIAARRQKLLELPLRPKPPPLQPGAAAAAASKAPNPFLAASMAAVVSTRIGGAAGPSSSSRPSQQAVDAVMPLPSAATVSGRQSTSSMLRSGSLRSNDDEKSGAVQALSKELGASKRHTHLPSDKLAAKPKGPPPLLEQDDLGKRLWQETANQADEIAAERRAGRQLMRQQAMRQWEQATSSQGRGDGALSSQASDQQHRQSTDQALLDAMSSPRPLDSPRRNKLERSFSELSRHTTDAGYLSATRSRRSSRSSIEDEDEEQQGPEVKAQ